MWETHYEKSESNWQGRQPAAANVAADVAVAVSVASHAAISEAAGSQRKCACRQHVEMRIEMEMEMGMEMQMEMHIKMWRGEKSKATPGKDKVNAETQRPATECGAFPKMDIFLFSNVNLLSCRVRERDREQSEREFLWFSFRCQSAFGVDVLEQRVRVQS